MTGLALDEHRDGGTRVYSPGTTEVVYRRILKSVTVFVVLFFGYFFIQVIQSSFLGFQTAGLKFFTDSLWNFPNLVSIWPLVAGTLVTSALALLIAIPLGIAASIVIAFVLPYYLRTTVITVVGMLAVIPSIIYGVWGLTFLVRWSSYTAEPWLSKTFHGAWPFSGIPRGSGILVGSIVLAVMVLPTIVAVTVDVFNGLPKDIFEGSYALGATKAQVIRKTILPASRTGIIGACTFALARAMGETVALATVLGGTQLSHYPNSLLAEGSTLASTIVSAFGGGFGSETSELYCLGVFLLVLIFAISLIARRMVKENVTT